jgi:hypothetical protein
MKIEENRGKATKIEENQGSEIAKTLLFHSLFKVFAIFPIFVWWGEGHVKISKITKTLLFLSLFKVFAEFSDFCWGGRLENQQNRKQKKKLFFHSFLVILADFSRKFEEHLRTSMKSRAAKTLKQRMEKQRVLRFCCPAFHRCS